MRRNAGAIPAGVPVGCRTLRPALRGLSLGACLLTGCGGDADTGADAPVQASAWAPSVGEDPADPALDAAATAQALREALLAARGWSAAPVFALWDAAMTHAEPGCPGVETAGAIRAWVADCTTGAGARFSGYGYLEEPPGGFARAWWGSARVTTPAGETLRLGGRAELQQEPGTPLPALSVVRGTFAGPGGDWIDAEVGVDLELRRGHDPEGTTSLVYAGGASGLSLAGGAFTAVAMDARLDRPPPGRTAEPAGWVALRDAAGRWVEVAFHAPEAPDADAPVEAYDGCGDVDGRPVCVDLAGVLEEAW